MRVRSPVCPAAPFAPPPREHGPLSRLSIRCRRRRGRRPPARPGHRAARADRQRRSRCSAPRPSPVPRRRPSSLRTRLPTFRSGHGSVRGARYAPGTPRGLRAPTECQAGPGRPSTRNAFETMPMRSLRSAAKAGAAMADPRFGNDSSRAGCPRERGNARTRPFAPEGDHEAESFPCAAASGRARL